MSGVTCQVSHVRCYMSLVMCPLSHFCSRCSVCYQQGLLYLVFRLFGNKNVLIQFFSNLDLGTFSWFSWALFHGQSFSKLKKKIVKNYQKKKIQKNCLNVCRSSQNCTGIILLELWSEGLFIQLKKICCCWITLICTTIQQCPVVSLQHEFSWQTEQFCWKQSLSSYVHLVYHGRSANSAGSPIDCSNWVQLQLYSLHFIYSAWWALLLNPESWSSSRDFCKK